ncbi:MAG: hypothetical protein EXR50_08295 [Dehalococcoidia bacterium]|nr:hypothetical protein [Dehalococcoidia bacterium]
MRNAFGIAKKEISSYFSSPMAYLIGAVFLVLTGVFFAQYLLATQEASMRGFFSPASFFLLLISPVITMRLIAEEQKMGTLELLLTSPVTDLQVVVGKFLASMAMISGMLLLTLYYFVLLLWVGSPDLGPVATGYFGLILLAGSILSVGLLASSFTSNQIVSAVVALGILLLLWLLGNLGSFFNSVPWARDILNYLSLSTHYSELVNGVLDTRDVVYYVSFIVLALFLTVRSLESRRWR